MDHPTQVSPASVPGPIPTRPPATARAASSTQNRRPLRRGRPSQPTPHRVRAGQREGWLACLRQQQHHQQHQRQRAIAIVVSTRLYRDTGFALVTYAFEDGGEDVGAVLCVVLVAALLAALLAAGVRSSVVGSTAAGSRSVVLLGLGVGCLLLSVARAGFSICRGVGRVGSSVVGATAGAAAVLLLALVLLGGGGCLGFAVVLLAALLVLLLASAGVGGTVVGGTASGSTARGSVGGLVVIGDSVVLGGVVGIIIRVIGGISGISS